MTDRYNAPVPKFSLGRIVMTESATQTLLHNDIATALLRHARGDWGDVCTEDRDANESALWDGLRLFSVYHDRKGVKFWIMTEADRNTTTVLLPHDY
jgi:hypothetical protein